MTDQVNDLLVPLAFERHDKQQATGNHHAGLGRSSANISMTRLCLKKQGQYLRAKAVRRFYVINLGAEVALKHFQ